MVGPSWLKVRYNFGPSLQGPIAAAERLGLLWRTAESESCSYCIEMTPGGAPRSLLSGLYPKHWPRELHQYK